MAIKSLFSIAVVIVVAAITPTASAQLPPTSIPKPISAGPEQSAGNSLAVPSILSGAKGGLSQTAVEVSSKPSPIPQLVGPGFSKVPSLPLTLGSTLPKALPMAVQAKLESPDGLAKGLAVPVSGQDRTPASSVSFSSKNKKLRRIPNLKSLTATGTNSTRPLRPTSSESMRMPAVSQFDMKLQGAAIQVQTLGPRSISVNKPAAYEIRVANNSDIEAKGINVALGFPEFVEVLSVQPNAGTYDQDAKSVDGRIRWRMERLAANSIQTIVVNLTPRQARLFDLQVDWSTDSIKGSSSIEVTEPKLMMTIAGPADVLYGEKALYTVTLRNPGTGVAEDVEIMLSEKLGGQRANVGNIAPGRERSFEVELVPGEAGTLKLEAFATALNIEQAVSKEVVVRRANLKIVATGAPALYAGTLCHYTVTVKNEGDAVARDVVAATVLPNGAEYVSGIEEADQVAPGLRWTVGTLVPGAERSYKIICRLNKPGELRMEAGIRGSGDLEATSIVKTHVEALADLVLSVQDPKGPLPVKQDMEYTIRVVNRGSKPAENIQLAMQFSEGIEPISASGIKYQVEPGQITFSQLSRIEVGKEVLIKVKARASTAGNHRFRAVLNSVDPKTEEIAQGTTKFFGSELNINVASPTKNGSQYNTGSLINDSLRR